MSARHRLRYLLCLGLSVTGTVFTSEHPLRAEAPEISDPNGLVPDGGAPGTYPTGVTAANINIQPIPGSELNGTNQNNLKVTFPAAGPIKWTESRHNEGDIALLIGPGQPNDPSYYPPNDYFNDYKPINGGDFENTTLAWRVSRTTGNAFATVRHNGVNNADTANGTPVGTIHGVAYMNMGFGQGYGFRMDDGVFDNGGGQSSDLQMGVAGNDGGAGEASFNVSVAYFPYEEGWIGGWVANGGDIVSGSPDNPVAVEWDGDVARLSLGASLNPDNVMMFVAPGNSDNNSKIAAASRDTVNKSVWNVAVREDNDFDLTGQTLASGKSEFQFLVLPYDTTNLIGGHILGANGAVEKAASGNRFTVTQRAQGEYAIKILGTDGQTALTENDGMLVLSTTGTIGSLPDRAFLSYQYDAAAKSFIVQARELTAINDAAKSENQFGDVLSLENTDFYFAYVDFQHPPTMGSGGVKGDYNADGLLTAADIDALSQALRAGSQDTKYDLNQDGAINGLDHTAWIVDVKKTYVGDSNLDGEFSSADFVSVFQTGQYEDGVAKNSTWGTGDWNGDAEFDSGDFVDAFQQGGYELGPRAAVASVPEPSAAVLAALSMLGCLARRRRIG